MLRTRSEACGRNGGQARDRPGQSSRPAPARPAGESGAALSLSQGWRAWPSRAAARARRTTAIGARTTTARRVKSAPMGMAKNSSAKPMRRNRAAASVEGSAVWERGRTMQAAIDRSWTPRAGSLMDAGRKCCRCPATHLHLRPVRDSLEVMTPAPPQAGKHLRLVGGGHAHVFVLEAFARRPEPGLRLTLVAKDRLTPYSGMLPGHMAGIYPRQAMEIDLERLARRAGAGFVQAEAAGFDAAGKRVLLRGGEAVPYDLLSIDIGIVPDLSGIHGAEEHALAAKPIGGLLAKWDRLAAPAADPEGPRRFAVVGAGVAGICLAFAVAASLRARAAGTHVALIGPALAPDLNAGM